MTQIIFRNDDVSPNSNLDYIREMYATIKEYFPDARIISAVNIFSKSSEDRSPYPKLKPVDIDFPKVDRMMDLSKLEGLEEIASHGLFHLDHRAASKDLQEISIRASCEILGTKIFVPPFLRTNEQTESICRRHGIEIMGGLWEDDWINLDNEDAVRGHQKFLFHSWKFTPESFRKRFAHLEK